MEITRLIRLNKMNITRSINSDKNLDHIEEVTILYTIQIKKNSAIYVSIMHFEWLLSFKSAMKELKQMNLEWKNPWPLILLNRLARCTLTEIF